MIDVTEPTTSGVDLQKMRNQLESVFRSLTTIQALIMITGEVLANQSADFASEISLVLMRCVSNPLHEEMKVLTSIIEGLGGRTGYSNDEDDPDCEHDDTDEDGGQDSGET